MRRATGLTLICVTWLAALTPASALDPSKRLFQYKHTVWTVDEGGPGTVGALAQGRDGYLWIGARDGLYRFDGLTFELVPPERVIGERTGVGSLLATRDGSIWVGYGAGGVERYRGGALRDTGMPHSDAYVAMLAEARDGAVWAVLGRQDLPLMRFARGRWEEFGAARGVPQDQITSLIATRDGSIWATYKNSMVVLRPGAARFETVPVARSGRGTLSEDPAGRVWISDDWGSRPIFGPPLPGAGGRNAYPTSAAKRSTRAFFDRDGNLWGKPANGIFRIRSADRAMSSSAEIRAAAVETFGVAEGLTADTVNAIIEDREGNIWVGTGRGLERFRHASVALEPKLTNRAMFGDVLLAASDGTVYVGQADAVYRILPGGQPEPLIQHIKDVEAMCEGPDRAVWIVLPDRIERLRAGKMSAMGRPKVVGDWVRDCAVDRRNTLWLTAGSLGMFRQEGGGWKQLTDMVLPDGEGVGFVQADRDRNLQVVVQPNRLLTIGPRRSNTIQFGTPGRSTNIRTLYPTPSGLLMGGKFGLARWTGKGARLVSFRRFPALDNVTGLAQTPDGGTWTIGRRGLARWPTAELTAAFLDPRRPVVPRLFDDRDGAGTNYVSDETRAIVRGGDGRLWIATYGGTVSVDPTRLTSNELPPPVVISGVKTKGRSFRDPTALALDAGTSSMEIDFAVPSLSIPQRVQVRYKLEGADRDWVDPGQRRQAFYTNLGAGHYSFRVIAANDSGVWNRTGATLSFDIPPTFFQSKWFLALCALGIALFLWVAYRLRVRHLQAGMRATLEQRLAERERIARDLHDTLLQGFQGLIYRFQSVANGIPRGDRTRKQIEEALDSADAVLTEGRNSVTQLRAARSRDLPEELASVAERLGQGNHVEFGMSVEGEPREVHPVIREELCRIGSEALINAFRHAQATRIDLEICYRSSGLTLAVGDDGTGIDAEVFIRGGRQGHFGLAGMRERAEQIEAQFDIASQPGEGTRISVAVPGSVAFADRRRGWLHRALRNGEGQ